MPALCDFTHLQEGVRQAACPCVAHSSGQGECVQGGRQTALCLANIWLQLVIKSPFASFLECVTLCNHLIYSFILFICRSDPGDCELRKGKRPCLSYSSAPRPQDLTGDMEHSKYSAFSWLRLSRMEMEHTVPIPATRWQQTTVHGSWGRHQGELSRKMGVRGVSLDPGFIRETHAPPGRQCRTRRGHSHCWPLLQHERH